MWLDVKVREKRREKAFMEKVNAFHPKATPHLAPSTSHTSLIQLYPG